MENTGKVTILPYVDGPHSLVSGHAKRPAIREYIVNSYIKYVIAGAKSFTDFDKFMRAYESGCEISIYRVTYGLSTPHEHEHELVMIPCEHEREIATVKKWGKNANPLTDKILNKIARTEGANGQTFR